MERSGATLALLVIAVATLKFLLLYGYRSTDFEVHRNWLAVTYSLPLEKWYVDHTSEWTLDYPPFFAYFERALAQFAPFFDIAMLRVTKDAYASFETVLFQRLTVILTEFLLIYASIRLSKQLEIDLVAWAPDRLSATVFAVQILSVMNVGLLIVDNVHFQYNGFLFGILLLSIAFYFEKRVVLSALTFATLLYLKHIFLYVAPAFFAVMLRSYCFDLKPGSNVFRDFRTFKIFNLLKLGISVITVTFLAFGPFLYAGGFEQLSLILGRLFPFKRGLTHAYWAPNLWALYNFADFSLYHILKITGGKSWVTGTPTYVSGLVHEFDHTVLPNVSPRTTAILFLAIALPVFALTVLFGWQRRLFFIRAISWFGFASYMVGWHVHEKAILAVIIPLTFVAFTSRKDVKLSIFISIVGHVSLTPLLFTGFEILLKHCLIWLSIALTSKLAMAIHPLPSSVALQKNVFGLIPRFIPHFGVARNCYGYFVLLLSVLVDVVPRVRGISRYEFLPLMCLSVVCSLGLLVAFVEMTLDILASEWGLDCWKLWRFRRIQANLKPRVSESNAPGLSSLVADKGNVFKIAGFDMTTLDGDDSFAVASVAVLEYPSLKVIEVISETFEIDVQYRAGYLAFREVDPLLRVYSVAKKTHDIKICFIDGNGLLHPNGFGLACHFGVLADIPTIGVAKNLHHIDQSILKHKRDFREELISPGQSSPLISREGRLLGAALRATRESVNPVFVSIGHKIGLDTAVEMVANVTVHRVPEPVRMADQVSRAEVRKLQEEYWPCASKSKKS